MAFLLFYGFFLNVLLLLYQIAAAVGKGKLGRCLPGTRIRRFSP